MPIRTQKWITRSDLRNNPNTIYVFGDNMARVGMGGQAKEMRGEPNALGVVTKATPAHGPGAYLDDSNGEHRHAVEADLMKVLHELSQGKDIVWPEDGIGTGLAKLETEAPEILQFIEDLKDLFFEKYGLQTPDS